MCIMTNMLADKFTVILRTYSCEWAAKESACNGADRSRTFQQVYRQLTRCHQLLLKPVCASRSRSVLQYAQAASGCPGADRTRHPTLAWVSFYLPNPFQYHHPISKATVAIMDPFTLLQKCAETMTLVRTVATMCSNNEEETIVTSFNLIVHHSLRERLIRGWCQLEYSRTNLQRHTLHQ
jgi:hypothetical protein